MVLFIPTPLHPAPTLGAGGSFPRLYVLSVDKPVPGPFPDGSQAVLAYHALCLAWPKTPNTKEKKKKKQVKVEGIGGHALAQQDEQRTSHHQQQTSRGGPMYCMSNLTSAVVVGCWSTKQSKANINRILPQIKSLNARSYVYSLLQVF